MLTKKSSELKIRRKSRLDKGRVEKYIQGHQTMSRPGSQRAQASRSSHRNLKTESMEGKRHGTGPVKNKKKEERTNISFTGAMMS